MKKLIIFNSVVANSRGQFLPVRYGKILHRSGQTLFAVAVVDNATEIDGKEVDTKKMILTGE